jgi:hypothetical protein
MPNARRITAILEREDDGFTALYQELSWKRSPSSSKPYRHPKSHVDFSAKCA